MPKQFPKADVSKVVEGDEWTDGMFNYIAYRKADGTMVVRDVEGFDYSMDEWAMALADDERTIAVVDDLEPYVRIERWEAECEVLPR